ncbi:lipopolysaccharide biosynthesis protein [Niameybacter massiliensis]|uniref:lipopolysaccharide biosynthesis protein n=1 Tax=Niameybacter massiliensis TaxID=1658108 RepID=UPI0006B4EC12|nr:oligosaccharide flippase family protein [Niameybacter massiliensis]
MLKNKLSSPIKASLWFMIANFIQSAIGILTTPIFTRILSEQEYGKISIYQSWLTLLTVILTLSIASSTYNKGMIDFKNNIKEYTSSLLILTTLSTIIFYVVYRVFQHPIQQIIQLPPQIIDLLFIVILLSPAMSFWTMQERFNYKYKLCTVLVIFTAFFNALLGYIGVCLYPQEKYMSKIIFSSIVPLIINLIIYIYIIFQGKFKVKIKYWIYAIKFSLPLIPHYISSTILNQADRIMIANIIGLDKAGIYSIGYSAASIMSMIGSAINSSYMPMTLKCMEHRNCEKIKKTSNIIIKLYIIISILFICATPEAVYILAPPEYREAIWIIPPVVIGIYFTFIYMLFANIEFYYKKTTFIMLGSLTAALINIFTNLIFINIFGYVAAAYTTLGGYLILAIMHYLFMKRIQEEEIYDIRYIIKLSLIFVGATFLIMLFFNNLIIRIIIVLVIIIVLMINIKNIKKEINSIIYK